MRTLLPSRVLPRRAPSPTENHAARFRLTRPLERQESHFLNHDCGGSGPAMLAVDITIGAPPALARCSLVADA